MKKTITIGILIAIMFSSLAGCNGCAGCNVSVDTPEITLAPTATVAPTQEVMPTPTEKVEPTIAPTETSSPVPTEVPVITEVVPTSTPEPAATPIPTSTPSPTPEPTATPIPTSTPSPTPELTATPIPTSTPSPTPELTATPVPTSTPTPTSSPVPTATPEPTSTPVPTATPTPIPVKGIEAGDYVTFGNYEQDNNFSNGKEPIEWLVLEVKGGKAFLISKYALDGHKYHSQKFVNDDPIAGIPFNVTWETSDLRAWLGSEFLNSAFTAEEQKSIVLTTVKNADHSNGTEGGNDTKDKVYLLSGAESLEYFGEAKWEGGSIGWRNINSLSFPTEYAKTRDIGYKENSRHWYGKYADWWLRSPGMGTNWASYVSSTGIYHEDGGYVTGTIGVRPVLWIDVETADVEKIK